MAVDTRDQWRESLSFVPRKFFASNTCFNVWKSGLVIWIFSDNQHPYQFKIYIFAEEFISDRLFIAILNRKLENLLIITN